MGSHTVLVVTRGRCAKLRPKARTCLSFFVCSFIVKSLVYETGSGDPLMETQDVFTIRTERKC